MAQLLSALPSPRPGRAVAAAVVLTLLAGTAPGNVRAAEPDEVRRTVRAVFEDGAYQTDFRLEPAEAGDDDWATTLPDDALEPRDAPAPEETGPAEPPAEPEPPPATDRARFARALLWTLLIAGGLLLVFFLAARLVRPTAGTETADGADQDRRRGAAAAGQAPAAVQGEADRLAESGRYAEAIHVLLTTTLEAMRRRRAGDVGPSLTSREIVRRVALPDEPAAALMRLVGAVELFHFGGRAADAADFGDRLGDYRTVTRALGGNG